jgi:hypothetical protein
MSRNVSPKMNFRGNIFGTKIDIGLMEASSKIAGDCSGYDSE